MRTVTFTMEDALISPEGFMILSGAGLVSATSQEKINVHVAENTDGIIKEGDKVYIVLEKAVSDDKNATIYVIPKRNDEFLSEPFIGTKVANAVTLTEKTDAQEEITKAQTDGKLIVIEEKSDYKVSDIAVFDNAEIAMVDYYTEYESGAQQIDITPDKFGGNYYLEASTLFRDQASGQDFPAEFIIPNCKIQSNFTFSMASSGDPSTFTFTMDAFPDYTRFNKTKKVLAAIQIIGATEGAADLTREDTKTKRTVNADGLVIEA